MRKPRVENLQEDPSDQDSSDDEPCQETGQVSSKCRASTVNWTAQAPEVCCGPRMDDLQEVKDGTGHQLPQSCLLEQHHRDTSLASKKQSGNFLSD